MSFLLNEVTHSQFQGLRCGHLWGTIILPTRVNRCGKEDAAVNIQSRLIFQEVWIISEEEKLEEKRE